MHGICVELTGPLSTGSAYTVTAYVNGTPTVIRAQAGEGSCSVSCFLGGVVVSAGDCLTVRDTVIGQGGHRAAACVVWVAE